MGFEKQKSACASELNDTHALFIFPINFFLDVMSAVNPERSTRYPSPRGRGEVERR